MLRRTVLKAFGSAPDPDPEGPDPEGPGPDGLGWDAPGRPSAEPVHPGRPGIRWSLAVDRLFEDVLSLLRRSAVAAAEVGGAEVGGVDAGCADAGCAGVGGDIPPDGAAPRLDGPRSRLDGVEFVLEGPCGRLRCVNTLRGFLRVRREPRGEGGPAARTAEDLITLVSQGGGYRPVLKPLVAERHLSERRRSSGGRSPFRFTSVPALAADFRRFVLGAGPTGAGDAPPTGSEARGEARGEDRDDPKT